MTCREFRKIFSLTLCDVSAETGFSPSAISKWEREIDTMPKVFVDLVKQKYGVDIERQWKNTVTKGKYNTTIADYNNKINKLQERISNLEAENAKLKYKLNQILKLAGE